MSQRMGSATRCLIYIILYRKNTVNQKNVKNLLTNGKIGGIFKIYFKPVTESSSFGRSLQESRIRWDCGSGRCSEWTHEGKLSRICG